MAPEEILGSTDASRREFLKKVLVGTTFAAPVVASFSTRGLSPAVGGAGFVSNQSSTPPPSPCCNSAPPTPLQLPRLALEAIEADLTLVKPVGKALAAMGEGFEKGQGLCTNKAARDQFKKAGK